MLTNIKLAYEFKDEKKYREILCTNFISDEPNLSAQIIEFWKLDRVYHKYLSKIRLYDENSYVKRKVREEEMIFIKNSIIYNNFRYFVKAQMEYQWEIEKYFEIKFIDRKKDLLIYNKCRTSYYKSKYKSLEFYLIKKNGEVNVELLKEVLQIKSIRNRIINSAMTSSEDNKLHMEIINMYNLDRINLKYIRKIRDYDESYYAASRLKEEEIYFILKTFLFELWCRQMVEFHQIEDEARRMFMSKEFQINQDKQDSFIKILIDEYMNEFYKE